MKTLKHKLVILCSAAAVCLGTAIVPAAAENTTAHRETRTMRHPMKKHHSMGNMMMRRSKR